MEWERKKSTMMLCNRNVALGEQAQLYTMYVHGESVAYDGEQCTMIQ